MIHFLIKERGKIIQRKTAADLKHIIYWVFEGITASMSRDYELANRIEKQDPRRIAFKKQEELIGQINPDYAVWCKNEHNKILIKNPFND